MSPYLLFGFIFAGFLSVLVTPETVQKHLGGRGFIPVFKAALFGIPLPLCSCGVIPVSASLRRHGSSKGATAAFLISTPQTGIDSIAVTYGMLGPVMAIFRPIAAFASGLLGGWLIDVTDKKHDFTTVNETCTGECCASGQKRNPITRALHYGLITLPRDIAKPLIVGLVVAGIISALVPENFFSETIRSGIAQMFIMLIVGLPLYVCATASVPIAMAMIMKGISPGAALVFLVPGPAMNAATLTTVWKILGKRATFIYLLVVAGTALISGILLDGIFNIGQFSSMHHIHELIPEWLQVASAIIVIIMLAATFIKPNGQHHHEHSE